MTIRIVSINIRHGGGDRVIGLGNWLLSKSPKVVVLPEWRNNPSGERIRKRLSDEGLHTATTLNARLNSVLLASRVTTGWRDMTPPNAAAGALILIEIDPRLRILGCYFPQRRAKAPFFERCIEVARDAKDTPLVIIGDLNTGRNDLDIEGTGTRFHCADLFRALSEKAGLVDLWRACNGDRREWTWRSPVNGFRVDHAFGNQALIEHFPAYRCSFDHGPRQTGLTDHSAIILDLSR
jgi:exodeoxyribonuclease-3